MMPFASALHMAQRHFSADSLCMQQPELNSIMQSVKLRHSSEWLR